MRTRLKAQPPFTEDQVVYRYVPAPAAHEAPAARWDVAQEYVIVDAPDAVHGILVYARHTGGWLLYPAGSRALLARLLLERAQRTLTIHKDAAVKTLTAQRDRLFKTCEQQLTLLREQEQIVNQQHAALEMGAAQIQRLLAERACYTRALEVYSRGWMAGNGPQLAIEKLAEGEQIRKGGG